MRRRLIALLLLGSCWAAPYAAAATPPKQPEKGPGGADYAVSEVVKRYAGTASNGSYVFHAAGPASAPRPVAVFFHSWGGVNPAFYGGWIEHLARKGYLVVFPRFQEVNRSRPADASDKAVQLVHDALVNQLAGDADARPDPARVAYIGHSAGVPIALNVAAGAKEAGVPPPKLIFGLMPGGIAASEKDRGILLRDLSGIEPSTMLITLIGDREHLPSDRLSKRILQEASAIPASRKLFLRAQSDDHGFPALTATLASPGSPKADYDISVLKVLPNPPPDPRQKNTFRWSADMALSGPQTILTQQLGNNATDSLDYMAFWKTFDIAAEAAFAGKDATALLKDPKLTDTGNWSDGWPVRRLSAQMPKAEGTEAQQERSPRRRF